MAKTRIKSNSAAILHAIIKLGLSSTDAAKSVGIQPPNFAKLINRDSTIHYSTAKKLVRVFGEDSISIVG